MKKFNPTSGFNSPMLASRRNNLFPIHTSSLTARFLIIICILSAILMMHNTAVAEDSKFPPKGSTVIEQLALHNAITEQIKLLNSERWDNRKNAKEALLKLIKQNKYAFRFFIATTKNSKNPEIKLSSKELLFDYFKKNIYNPNKGNGFIGIQLSPAGVVKVKDQLYSPIMVAFPVVGYPGAKAGIKTNDLILQIDKFKCTSKFGIDDFVTYIATKSPGEKVILKLLSRGKVISKTVVLAKRPESEMGSLPKKSTKDLFKIWYKEIKE